MTPACPAQQESDFAAEQDFAGDVRRGLAQSPKRVPSKYFYDARGSELFEQICEQPEYYLTRTELSILRDKAGEIAAAIGPRALLVEYGSGSAIKTRILLDALQQPVAYVPIEISHSALSASVASLQSEFPEVDMLPLSADFSRRIDLPKPARTPLRSVIYFPGSTLGNFETREAIGLLRNMHVQMGANGMGIVGIDLKKDCAILNAAYNDAAGITRDFTLNLLTRMNRDLDADFDLARFRHRASYNAMAGRIETHIASRVEQVVHVDGRQVAFAADEAMLVEISCKYAQADFESMAAKAGLRVLRTWTDAREYFAIQMLQRV